MPSESLEASAHHLPMRFRDWKEVHHFQTAAIRSETGLPLYDDLKTVLRLMGESAVKDYMKELPPQIVSLATAVGKLPPYKGKVFLGVAVSPSEAKEWFAGLKKGIYLADPGFFSVTRDRAVALRLGKSILLEMKSSSGVDISGISVSPDDKEILFAPGTRFHVDALKRQKSAPEEPPLLVQATEVDWTTQQVFFEPA